MTAHDCGVMMIFKLEPELAELSIKAKGNIHSCFLQGLHAVLYFLVLPAVVYQ